MGAAARDPPHALPQRLDPQGLVLCVHVALTELAIGILPPRVEVAVRCHGRRMRAPACELHHPLVAERLALHQPLERLAPKVGAVAQLPVRVAPT